ncbi:MAG: OB-fold nucleic acid binding domain-containing protein [Tateyamaria sp.]|uniref:OB-fold nucleic acid binding domain-containing protein n=1 Tax=Tateyamaria sp. TaxID=1929288 RepID=UPI00329FB91E
MRVAQNLTLPPPGTPARDWPRPPSCLRACDLNAPPVNARIAVAGLVILRQRPGTAKGVIFITLEDETGVVNIIVWRHIYERFRRAVVAGRMLRVTGRMQRAHSVTHVLAEEIEDISLLLDQLLAEDTGRQMAAEARTETWDGRK